MRAQLASALTGLLRPLADALDDASALESLAASAGWYLDEVPTDDALAALGDALGIGDDLATLKSSADPLAILEAGGHVLGRLTELASGDPADWVAAVADAAAALPAPLNDPEALLQAIGDIADGLLTRWLEQSLAVVHVALRSAGVLAGSLPERVEWQRLIDLAANPASVLTETYSWGEKAVVADVRRADAGARVACERAGPVGPGRSGHRRSLLGGRRGAATERAAVHAADRGCRRHRTDRGRVGCGPGDRSGARGAAKPIRTRPGCTSVRPRAPARRYLSRSVATGPPRSQQAPTSPVPPGSRSGRPRQVASS